MSMPRSSGPGVATVIAAQAGDAGALDSLLSAYLPSSTTSSAVASAGTPMSMRWSRRPCSGPSAAWVTCAIPPHSGPGW